MRTRSNVQRLAIGIAKRKVRGDNARPRLRRDLWHLKNTQPLPFGRSNPNLAAPHGRVHIAFLVHLDAVDSSVQKLHRIRHRIVGQNIVAQSLGQPAVT